VRITLLQVLDDGLPEGADVSVARSAVMAAVRDAFRPEFLNRLDEILLFRRLSRDDMKEIVAIQLEHLKKLLADRKITLEVDAAASAWLANAGRDPVYGARPLKRVIQRELQNPRAQQILEGRIPDGATVHVGAGDGGLEIAWPRRNRRPSTTLHTLAVFGRPTSCDPVIPAEAGIQGGVRSVGPGCPPRMAGPGGPFRGSRAWRTRWGLVRSLLQRDIFYSARNPRPSPVILQRGTRLGRLTLRAACF
jgi:C-terminal, D2-small domain, of ClpB protein